MYQCMELASPSLLQTHTLISMAPKGMRRPAGVRDAHRAVRMQADAAAPPDAEKAHAANPRTSHIGSHCGLGSNFGSQFHRSIFTKRGAHGERIQRIQKKRLAMKASHAHAGHRGNHHVSRIFPPETACVLEHKIQWNSGCGVTS